MLLKTKLFGKVYSFSSIKEVLAKANEKRSGDVLAGIAAESMGESLILTVFSGFALQGIPHSNKFRLAL